MSKPKTLLQFDPDSLPSSFDSIVAIDAGVDFLLPYGQVGAKEVERLVHGCIFTRGPQDLCNTAIFIGGTDVRAGEEIAGQVKKTFFGPMRVSVMLDSNGCNSTAAAAVISAAQHYAMAGSRCLVLGATGSVGRRVCQLLALRGAHVTVASRSLTRAQSCCRELELLGISENNLSPLEMNSTSVAKALSGSDIVFGCGAAGAELASSDALNMATNLKVAVDLNAVSPTGLGGVEIHDKAKSRNGRIDYGALGVGGLKMKIHKAAIQQLFSRNDLFLDAEQMMEIGESLVKAAK
jgi:methylenetetrahydrofolate/methylenetetrahydromethanopterin dehydrogenase (NADP+)